MGRDSGGEIAGLQVGFAGFQQIQHRGHGGRQGRLTGCCGRGLGRIAHGASTLLGGLTNGSGTLLGGLADSLTGLLHGVFGGGGTTGQAEASGECEGQSCGDEATADLESAAHGVEL